MKRLVLTSFQSPGDVVLLTAAVRDLHVAHPGRFATDVRSSAPELWENNPHLTPLDERSVGVERIDMHYPLIHESNQRPYHFLHGYTQYLESRLDVRIPVTRFHGDVHLSAEEKAAPPPGRDAGVPEHYWLLVAGGKYDFTAKWWNPGSYQAVVDHFVGRIRFVQCGQASHWHPRLRGVVDLIGRTSTREFVRLTHHADGVVCPVTFAMHLGGGGRGSTGPAWRSSLRGDRGRSGAGPLGGYPNHQFISTNGALTCCRHGGCWKSRCQLVGDGDSKDVRDVCEQPVQVAPDLRIPRCLDLISPDDVIRRIEWYFLGGAMTTERTDSTSPLSTLTAGPVALPALASTPTKSAVLLEFRHGLGDAVQLRPRCGTCGKCVPPGTSTWRRWQASTRRSAGCAGSRCSSITT